jgi:hypothetical protein
MNRGKKFKLLPGGANLERASSPTFFSPRAGGSAILSFDLARD